MIARSRPDFFDTLQGTIVDSPTEGGFFGLNPGQKILAVSGGRDTSTTEQIPENPETRKTRVQNEKVFLVDDPRPLTVSPFWCWSDTPATQAPEEKPFKGGQTRRGSLLESLVNILAGYSINFVANLLIFPLFGWHISARENLTLGVIYTGISLVRSYGLRRLFNRRAVGE